MVQQLQSGTEERGKERESTEPRWGRPVRITVMHCHAILTHGNEILMRGHDLVRRENEIGLGYDAVNCGNKIMPCQVVATH